MTTAEKIRAFILSEMGWKGPAEELTPDFPLIDHGVIDSLGLFMLVSFIGQQFGVTIEYDELNPRDFATISAMAGLIERKRGMGDGAPVASGPSG